MMTTCARRDEQVPASAHELEAIQRLVASVGARCVAVGYSRPRAIADWLVDLPGLLVAAVGFALVDAAMVVTECRSWRQLRREARVLAAEFCYWLRPPPSAEGLAAQLVRDVVRLGRGR